MIPIWHGWFWRELVCFYTQFPTWETYQTLLHYNFLFSLLTWYNVPCATPLQFHYKQNIVICSQERLIGQEGEWGVLLGPQISQGLNWCNLLDKYYKVYCRTPVFACLSQVFCKSYHIYWEVISMSYIHIISYNSIIREPGLDIVHLYYRGRDTFITNDCPRAFRMFPYFIFLEKFLCFSGSGHPLSVSG